MHGGVTESWGLAAQKPKQEPCLGPKLIQRTQERERSRFSLKFGKL
jgi:hypothetical protein